jgi:hypothetical protein
MKFIRFYKNEQCYSLLLAKESPRPSTSSRFRGLNSSSFLLPCLHDIETKLLSLSKPGFVVRAEMNAAVKS